MYKYLLVSLSCVSLFSNIFAMSEDEGNLQAIGEKIHNIQAMRETRGDALDASIKRECKQAERAYGYLQGWIMSGRSLSTGLRNRGMDLNGYMLNLDTIIENLNRETQQVQPQLTQTQPIWSQTQQVQPQLTQTQPIRSQTLQQSSVRTASSSQSLDPQFIESDSSRVINSFQSQMNDENRGHSAANLISRDEYIELFGFNGEMGDARIDYPVMEQFVQRVIAENGELFRLFNEVRLLERGPDLLRLQNDERFSPNIRELATGMYNNVYKDKTEEQITVTFRSRNVLTITTYLALRQLIVDRRETELGHQIADLASMDRIALQQAQVAYNAALEAAAGEHVTGLHASFLEQSLEYVANLRRFLDVKNRLDAKMEEERVATLAAKSTRDEAAVRYNEPALKTDLENAKTVRDTNQAAFDAANAHYKDTQNTLLAMLHTYNASVNAFNAAKLLVYNSQEASDAQDALDAKKEEVAAAVMAARNQPASLPNLLIKEAELQGVQTAYNNAIATRAANEGLAQKEEALNAANGRLKDAGDAADISKNNLDVAQGALDASKQRVEALEAELVRVNNNIDADAAVQEKTQALRDLNAEVQTLREEVTPLAEGVQALEPLLVERMGEVQNAREAVSEEEHVVAARNLVDQLRSHRDDVAE